MPSRNESRFRIRVKHFWNPFSYARFLVKHTKKKHANITPDGFQNPLSSSVIFETKPKRYRAGHIGLLSYALPKIAHFHEGSHFRQIVFHHEKNFPLNAHSVLAQIEEQSLFTYSAKLSPAEWNKRTFDEMEKLTKSTRYALRAPHFLFDVAECFPSRTAAMRGLVELYRDPNMRLVLEELNRIPYTDPKGMQIAWPTVERIRPYLIEIIRFLKSRA